MSLSRAVVEALGDDAATLAALPRDEARILRAAFEKAKANDANSPFPMEFSLVPEEGVGLPGVSHEGSDHSLVNLKDGDAEGWAALASMRLQSHVAQRLVDAESKRKPVRPYRLLEPEAPVPSIEVPPMSLRGESVALVEENTEVRRKAEMAKRVAMRLPPGATPQNSAQAALPAPPTAPGTPGPAAAPIGSTDRARALQTLQDALSNVLQRLKKNKDHSWPFRRPVTPQEAPDYRSIISEPMDLGTMRTRLEAGYYTTKALFTRDLELIWSNCFRYNNDPSSPFRTNARTMKALADSLLSQIPEVPEQTIAFTAPSFTVPETIPLLPLPNRDADDEAAVRKQFYFQQTPEVPDPVAQGVFNADRAQPSLQSAVASIVLRNNYESVGSSHVLDVLCAVAEKAFTSLAHQVSLQGPDKAFDSVYPKGHRDISRYLVSMHKDEATSSSADKLNSSRLLSYVSQQVQAQQLQQAQQPTGVPVEEKRMDVSHAFGPLAKVAWRKSYDNSHPLFNAQRSIPAMQQQAHPHPQGQGSVTPSPGQAPPMHPGHSPAHHPGAPGPTPPHPHHHGPPHGMLPPGAQPPQMAMPMNPGMQAKRAREDDVEEPRYGTRNGNKKQRRDDEEGSGDDDGDADAPRQARPARNRSASVKQDPYIRD